MRILILSEAFPPETKSASTLFFELAESLVKSPPEIRPEHEVTVITRMPRYNVASGTDLKNVPPKEVLSGIKVYRYQTPPLARGIPIIRGFDHFLLGLIFFMGGLSLGNFDVILVYSPPLPLGVAGVWLGKIKKSPVVINVQDLYPQTVIDLGFLKNKFLIWVSRKMESFIYKSSDALTVHSEGNKEYLISRGASPHKVKVINNWVDTETITSGNKDNEFSRRFGLDGKFVVSFAGVIGFAQGLEVVVQTADILREHSNIVFVLVGDGVKKSGLEKMAESLRLNNVLFVPTQPRSVYPQILHASDICLVTLSKDLLTPVVPGKMLSIMAAGKLVLASLPLAGDASKIIDKYGCGIAVEAGNPQLLATAILKLYNDRPLCEEMGRRGREVAEKIFSRMVCVNEYQRLFNDISRRGS
jgi:glycosyltransferase involved in cell wall biosynthesis